MFFQNMWNLHFSEKMYCTSLPIGSQLFSYCPCNPTSVIYCNKPIMQLGYCIFDITSSLPLITLFTHQPYLLEQALVETMCGCYFPINFCFLLFKLSYIFFSLIFPQQKCSQLLLLCDVQTYSDHANIWNCSNTPLYLMTSKFCWFEYFIDSELRAWIFNYSKAYQ